MIHYQFPIITQISDVLPAIEGDKAFIIADRGDHTVLNYVLSGEETFPDMHTAGGSAKMRAQRSLHKALRRECRGLIFDKDGKLIRRPYHKFFNIGERGETQANLIDLRMPHRLLAKLDGSQIAPYILPRGLIWGTKMGDTDVATPVHRFVEQNEEYYHFAREMILSGYTPIFEWQSRQQRIVLDHPEDTLTLTAIRDMTRGNYVPYDRMVEVASYRNIPVVEAFDTQAVTAAEIVEHIRQQEDVEGVVVRFDDGHMYKVKTDWYCQIHKAKEKITEERHVVEMILDDTIDDALALVPDVDRDRIAKYQVQIQHKLHDFAFYVRERIQWNMLQNQTKKDYALSDQKRGDTGFISQATFHFFGMPFADMELDVIRQYVIDKRVRPALSTRSKFGEMKNEVFPNTRFYF